MAPKSLIWHFFEKDKIGKALCLTCNKWLSMGSNLPKRQSVTNIRKHLEKMHPDQWARLHAMKMEQMNELHTDLPSSPKRMKIENEIQTGIKQWTRDETLRLLKYLEEAGQFESPDAKTYYRKAISEANIEASAEDIQRRAQQLKRMYEKSQRWSRSKEMQELKNSLTATEFHAKLLEVCSYYDQLSVIFGDFNDEEKAYSPLVTYEDYNDEALTTAEGNNFECVDFTDLVDRSREEQTTNNEGTIEDDDDGNFKLKWDNSRRRSLMSRVELRIPKMLHTSLPGRSEKILELEERSLKLQEEKFRLQKRLRLAELALKREEIEIRKEQLQQDEIIRRLEVEKNIELRRYELDLIYKYKTQRNANV